MKFFRRQGKADSNGTITSRLNQYIKHKQRELADWLNSKAVKLSFQTLFFWLIVFCSVFGGYFLYLLLNTFGVFR